MSRATMLTVPTAERTLGAHEAAEHDAWFRAEVQKTLSEADDPQAEWVSHEEVKRELAALLASLANASTARS